MKNISRMLASATILASLGCTHTQLRYDTVRQARTTNRIFEQQVLDNLAMFCSDPNALPFFAIPTTGGNKVTDKGSLSGGAPLNPFFTKIGLNADRTIAEDWSLDNVVDPEKLARMRCAYQKAVGYVDQSCVNCCELEKQWLGKTDTVIEVIGADGKPRKDDGRLIRDPQNNMPFVEEVDGSGVYAINPDPRTGRPYVLDPVRDTAARTFTVQNHDCFGPCAIGPGWYCSRDKKMIAHPCDLIGEYCGMYVWVCPEGRDQFTRLVLTIVNYAVNEPSPPVVPRMKIVERRFYDDQNLLVRTETSEEPVLPSQPDSDGSRSLSALNRLVQEGLAKLEKAETNAGAEIAALAARLQAKQEQEQREMRARYQADVRKYEQATGRAFDTDEALRLKYFYPQMPRPQTPRDPLDVERMRERIRDRLR